MFDWSAWKQQWWTPCKYQQKLMMRKGFRKLKEAFSSLSSTESLHWSCWELPFLLLLSIQVTQLNPSLPYYNASQRFFFKCLVKLSNIVLLFLLELTSFLKNGQKQSKSCLKLALRWYLRSLKSTKWSKIVFKHPKSGQKSSQKHQKVDKNMIQTDSKSFTTCLCY